MDEENRRIAKEKQTFYDIDTGALTDVPPGAVEMNALPALPRARLWKASRQSSGSGSSAESRNVRARGFCIIRPLSRAGVAQSAEQLIRNQ